MAQQYLSTRGGSSNQTFADVVLKGLADDGGLYIPHAIPVVEERLLADWSALSFQQLAGEIMGLYISESVVPRGDLCGLIERSFATFRHPDVTPVTLLDASKRLYLLELFHGPTYAFKDVALQFLGNLFEYFLQMAADPSVLTVLGATSGDTGSAAIQGLRNKKNVQVFILHPKNRISPIQEAQMTTVLDSNVHNIAIEGTFDDCQDIVKELFNDSQFRKKYHLAAVNSINWARILAQIVYYFYAYFRVVEQNRSDRIKVCFSVPTGNFGDILAGYFAKRMGLPIETLIVATNSNDILHRFWQSGIYEKCNLPADDHSLSEHAAVKETLSPAMDITVSSNFERLLWCLVFESSKTVDLGERQREAGRMVDSWMNSMKLTGRLVVPQDVFELAKRDFITDTVTDGEYYNATPSAVLDPHTAVGVMAAERAINDSSSDAATVTIALATAHPAKFSSVVDLALGSCPEYSFDKVSPPDLLELLHMERRVINIEEPSPQLVKEIIVNNV